MPPINDEGVTPEPPKQIGKSGLVEREKEVPEETVPGWTIMRPLKRKSKKGSHGGEVAKLVPSQSSNSNETRVDGQPGDDLKSTETHGSMDGVGEVDNLQDIRSDDELLDSTDGARSSRIRRQSPTHNLQGDGDPTGNGSTEYKVYKRRWFGLVQLILLNIVVSWDVSSCYNSI